MPKLILRVNGVNLKEFELRGTRVTIGRHSDNQIQLDDPAASGIHAILSLQADPFFEGVYKVTLMDFNSTNGIFVNSEKITQRELRHGDIIQIGQHEMLFEESEANAFEQTTIQIRED